VHEPIQYRVSKSRVGKDVVPLAYGHLAGDQRRPGLVAIFEDIQQVPCLFNLIWRESSVVQEQKLGLLQLFSRVG